MKTKKTVVISCFVALAALLVASGLSLAWVLGRVREFERAHGCDVFANRLPVPAGTNAVAAVAVVSAATNSPAPAEVAEPTNGVPCASAAASAATNVAETAAAAMTNAVPDSAAASTNAPPELKITSVSYDGGDQITMYLTRVPDMEVARRYISVEPLGKAGMSLECVRRSWWEDEDNPRIILTGDFAYRTNSVLRVRRGFPLARKGGRAVDSGALAEDFERTFVRDDAAPRVRFVDKGRYLPPVGAREIAVETLNVTNLHTEICRVEPRNVVQLLAREEDCYRHYWCRSDGGDAAELSGLPATNIVVCAHRPNQTECARLAVAPGDGGSANGIFLLGMRSGDRPCNWGNRMSYRLVCVSDLGLSARVLGGGELGVWVTSLTTGRPVAGVAVEVFSSANILVMSGVADANGWCVPRRLAPGEPFAVVASAPAGADRTFVALRDSMVVDETNEDGARAPYLAKGEVSAFAWTERGIYRHGESIFLHALLRDHSGRAPRPFPVEAVLFNPKGDVLASRALTPDADGMVSWDRFCVSEDQPDGKWRIGLRVPGDKKRLLGETTVRVEEFAPPQIRVTMTPAESAQGTNVEFSVAAEHLFGGPAAGLLCEAAAIFEDLPFEPDGWRGWRFGNDDLGLKPNFQRLEGERLDAAGRRSFAFSPQSEWGQPAAAVKVTLQGVVFEDGGRPATVRSTVTRHVAPYYVGSTLPDCLRADPGAYPKVRLACVTPDGSRLATNANLRVRLERVESVYAYRRGGNGWHTWDCEYVRQPVGEDFSVAVPAGGDAVAELPVSACGDYVLTVEDAAAGASFSRAFYLGGWGDDTVRAPLSRPTAVALATDRPFYRVGERPRIAVKSPFAGHALLTVLRERSRHTAVFALTNATSEVELPAVEEGDAPNLDVQLSVVQGVEAGDGHFAVRAHGWIAVPVRPADREIDVGVVVRSEAGAGGMRVIADVSAPGADFAAVTLVDEGINILTDEKVPDPVGFFAALRTSEHPLYDLYSRLLPVLGAESLFASGIRTGGDGNASLLRRVSPVPTRRFRPLAMWRGRVPVTNGAARVSFDIGEFAGEVRVTAVAWNARASGAAAKTCKATPRLVMRPDAPRFAAPGDSFDVTLPLYNRSGEAGSVACEILAGTQLVARAASVALARDGATNAIVRVTAPAEPGELELRFRAEGFGEVHEDAIQLPVRPAVAWRETAGVRRLAADETFSPEPGRFTWRMFDSPVAELAGALRWLAEYPHGCLEQTSSRLFPLVAAGGSLAEVGSAYVTNGMDCVRAGVRRVESMVRERDFTMWPDCNCPPWDAEVSVYAAHFLFAAERAGVSLNPGAREKVVDFLRRWSCDSDLGRSAYACLALALAGSPERDRMHSLYDDRARLSLLARARLSLAFALLGDRPRAEALLVGSAAPSDVREAAFAVLAMLELDPDDGRILPLVDYLNRARDRARNCWGTTGENAHALMAIGAYYRHRPPRAGERYVAWSRLDLPRPEEVADETNGISVARRLLDASGAPADLAALKPGALLVAELELASDADRTLSDVVIEDLFAGAFEPVRQELPPALLAPTATNVIAETTWVMRREARDDRMLVFSKKFDIRRGERAVLRYPLRAVTPGEYALPGPRAEAMYYPSVRATVAPSRVRVAR